MEADLRRRRDARRRASEGEREREGTWEGDPTQTRGARRRRRRSGGGAGGGFSQGHDDGRGWQLQTQRWQVRMHGPWEAQAEGSRHETWHVREAAGASGVHAHVWQTEEEGTQSAVTYYFWVWAERSGVSCLGYYGILRAPWLPARSLSHCCTVYAYASSPSVYRTNNARVHRTESEMQLASQGPASEARGGRAALAKRPAAPVAGARWSR